MHVSPLFYSYGNAAEEILWAVARARSEGREVRVVSPMRYTQVLGYRICNEHLFNLCCFNQSLKADRWSTVCTNLKFFAYRLGALALRKAFRVKLAEHFLFPREGLSSCWPFTANGEQLLEHVEQDPIIECIHQPLGITLSEEQCALADPVINAMIGGEQTKFVCLHVRDSGFHDDPSKRPYRNAEIESYRFLIEYLISQGLTVVRLGDPSMKGFEINRQGFVDYAHSPARNALVDLALISRCEYYIGMQSGPLDVALLFQKPVLVLNMYEWIYGFPLKTCDRGLLKGIRVKGRRSGSSLSLEERFVLPFKFTNVNLRLSEDEIQFSDNTASEILQVGEEFHRDYLSRFKRTPSDHLIRNRELFEQYSRTQIRSLLDGREEGYFNNPLEVSRLVYHNFASRGFYY